MALLLTLEFLADILFFSFLVPTRGKSFWLNAERLHVCGGNALQSELSNSYVAISCFNSCLSLSLYCCELRNFNFLVFPSHTCSC